jgi:4a-hydroxytetrahydrobiopterin dehydratase
MALWSNNLKSVSPVRAWTCLGINLFATPGLGSVMGGHKGAGRGQLLFSFAGFGLITTWMMKVFLGSMSSAMNGADAPHVPAWWWQVGAALFAIAWLWSLSTSVSMVMEARVEVAPLNALGPPKLAGPAKATPPRIIPAFHQPSFKVKPLDSFQISAALVNVPAWQRQGSAISRRFEFTDFAAAMLFVNHVARLADEVQHHPDIDIRSNMVTLALTTHDVGGLTERDFALARMFDRLV